MGREPNVPSETEERTAVDGSENFVVWTQRSPTVPDRGRDRQRARLSGRVSEATGRSDYRSEPAVKRAESPKGSAERILEIERVRFPRLSSLV
jgi:hypothetical protein